MTISYSFSFRRENKLYWYKLSEKIKIIRHEDLYNL